METITRKVEIVELSPLLVNVAEASRLLACSRQTIYDLTNSGELPYVQLHPTAPRRIDVQDLKALIERKKERVK